MRIAYLDCFSGISGDMFLGALVDAGVPPELLQKTVAGLGLDAKLEISRVTRSGISAIKVDVIVHGEKDRPRESPSHHHEHDRGHEHGHEHVHPRTRPTAGRERGAPSKQEHAHSHEHAHRGLREIRQIIANAPVSEHAKRTALAMFQALGEAEAKIHNTAVENIHFHEVGAADAIVDIVCAAVGAEHLAADIWVCSPLNIGGGTVECQHGRFPVPAPATVELLRSAPVYSSGIDAELVTPTGAAIVKTLASRFAAFPAMTIATTGYGAGTRDFAGHANVVRLTLGDALEEAAALPRDSVTVLEANLDDLSPQVFGYVMERALAEGALEVFGTPVQMKKNRPGMLLTVLARPADAERLAKLIFAETTTLGVRMRSEERRVLARREVRVPTPWGEVRMKVASLNGAVSHYAPEYEDCRRIAEERSLPLKQVMQAALRAYLDKESGEAS
ncbi:MAG TPA: nickel pincer cofactor biosynthesis protein LarC [Terriglobales bacterium]|nr:nickel pincer cofactor biosynthesis protein LarC [Terriglobales bacterium]